MIMISVVILSWNRKEELKRTLKDLGRQTCKDFEIVIVDQGSDDGVREYLQKECSSMKVIYLDNNIGVPGGRNTGARASSGDILVFLDNDASLSDDALEIVSEKFRLNEKLGIIGFKILNAENDDLDISSWAYQKAKIRDADREFETYTYCGCGHAIRKEVFEKVGYYWEDLVFSWEEQEYSLRVLDKGFDIIYTPEIKVYHRFSGLNRVFNPEHECLRLRNSLWVTWRYMPGYYALGHSIVRIMTYLVKSIKNRCLGMMVMSLVRSFSRIWLLFDKNRRISGKTFRKYIGLSRKGTILEQAKYLLTHG